MKIINKIKKIVKISVFLYIINSVFSQSALFTDIADNVTKQIEKMMTSNAEQMQKVDGITPSISINKRNTIKIWFIDVGQGDSILIRDNKKYILIDTGSSEGYTSLKKQLKKEKVKKINTLILTHPDADHIQNADEILNDYSVSKIYMPNIKNDTKTYETLISTIKKKKTRVYNPVAGDMLKFGKAKYEIIGPAADNTYDDINSHSIILKVTNGKNSFLFTGDATGEETINLSKRKISADVIKIAHHGSANDGCNDYDFLNKVNPKIAVISCGYQNSYGHPHRETMDYLKNKKIKIMRTDLQKTISCTSNGKKIRWNKNFLQNYENGNNLK